MTANTIMNTKRNIYKDAEHPFAQYIRIVGKGKTGARSLTYDEAYQALIVRPLIIGSTFLWKIFDMVIIDGLINGLAVALGEFSIGLRTVQTGSIRTYTAVFVIGVILLIGFIVIR